LCGNFFEIYGLEERNDVVRRERKVKPVLGDNEWVVSGW